MSYEYIRGLVEGEGCFTFCKTRSNGGTVLLPTFSIGMHERDKEMLKKMVLVLGLKNKIYCYRARKKPDGYNRGGTATLIVRDFEQIKNVIVPLFYESLVGDKAIQFKEWIQRMALEPAVPRKFKLIPVWIEKGFYDPKKEKFL